MSNRLSCNLAPRPRPTNRRLLLALLPVVRALACPPPAPARRSCVHSTMPTRSGHAGHRPLSSPPLPTTDAELTQMVERFAETIRTVARSVEAELK